MGQRVKETTVNPGLGTHAEGPLLEKMRAAVQEESWEACLRYANYPDNLRFSPEARARACNAMCYALDQKLKRHGSKAISYGRRAAELCQKHRLPQPLWWSSMINYGIAVTHTDQYNEALKLFAQVLELKPDTPYLIAAHFNMGLIFQWEGKHKVALERLDTALSEARPVKSNGQIRSIRIRQAHSHLSLGNLAIAEECLAEARSIPNAKTGIAYPDAVPILIEGARLAMYQGVLDRARDAVS